MRYSAPDGSAYLERVDERTFERLVPPGKGRTPAHVHEDLGQRFEILGGRARWWGDGEWQEGGPGAIADFRPGVAHVDPYSAGPEPLRWRQTIDPLPEPFVTVYFATLGGLIASGRTNRHGDLPSLSVLSVLHATKGRSWDARTPRALQRVAIPAGAALARLLGRQAVTG